MPERINARRSQPLAEFVDRMVGEAGLYETPSEYVRDLIRRDMERRGGQFVQDASWPGTETWRQAASLRHAGLDASPSPAQSSAWHLAFSCRATGPLAPYRDLLNAHIDLRSYAERKN